MADRMTLIAGHSFLPGMRRLGLSSTRFDLVFQEKPAVGANPSYAATVASGTNEGPKFPRKDSNGVFHLEVPPHRLGPIVFDAAGSRVDRCLKVDKAVANRIAKGGLCYWLYLRGRCEMVSHNNHGHRALTDAEYDALLEQARKGRCWKTTKAEQGKGQGCVDALCFYGHGK